MKEAGGKMCEPRLKSQRIWGRERDAGWDWSSGMSKSVMVAMAPEARRAVEMLRVLMKRVVVVLADMSSIDGVWYESSWDRLIIWKWGSWSSFARFQSQGIDDWDPIFKDD